MPIRVVPAPILILTSVLSTTTPPPSFWTTTTTSTRVPLATRVPTTRIPFPVSTSVRPHQLLTDGPFSRKETIQRLGTSSSSSQNNDENRSHSPGLNKTTAEPVITDSSVTSYPRQQFGVLSLHSEQDPHDIELSSTLSSSEIMQDYDAIDDAYDDYEGEESLDKSPRDGLQEQRKRIGFREAVSRLSNQHQQGLQRSHPSSSSPSSSVQLLASTVSDFLNRLQHPEARTIGTKRVPFNESIISGPSVVQPSSSSSFEPAAATTPSMIRVSTPGTSDRSSNIPYKSIFSVLFGNSGMPATVSLFPSKQIHSTETTTRKPTTTSRPLTMLDKFVRLMHATESQDLNGHPLSSAQVISHESESVKHFLIENIVPHLHKVFLSSRNSSLDVPLQDLHAYDPFGLDGDDVANSFIYLLLKNVFKAGFGKEKEVYAPSEEMMAFTQKLLNPSLYMNFARDAGIWRTESLLPSSGSQASSSHNQIHKDFEEDFDHMNEERWYQTPEFIASTCILSVLIILTVILVLVCWLNWRKSNSFHISASQHQHMNYEEGYQSKIVYM